MGRLSTTNRKLCITGQFTILNGATESNVIDLEGATSLALHIPSGWGTAGNITIEASTSATGTFDLVQDASITGTVSTWGAVDLMPFRFIRIVCALAATGDQTVEYLAKG